MSIKMMKGNFLLSFNPPDVIAMTRNTKNQEKCLGNQQGNRTYYLLVNSIVNKRFIFADRQTTSHNSFNMHFVCH